MHALRRMVAAATLAGAVSGSVLFAGPASAAETKAFYGRGMNNNYFTALSFATGDARSLAIAEGFNPDTQCSHGGSFTTQPWPGLYSVLVQINCTR
ncbi:hypothetical protein [Micromonospora okii]|uniref:hypothetical protein n=1 Tax=Micromonospora okii TaxID=1182970 RepID=UPI001E5AD404|nr:hypothetical protein [Micromonospora okii]